MPKRKRNNGRNKKHKGHSDPFHWENCKRLIPKDKAITGFLIKNMVDGSSKRVVEDQSVYGENYSMPRLFIKIQYCASCGIHARIVRVSSTANRRIKHLISEKDLKKLQMDYTNKQIKEFLQKKYWKTQTNFNIL